MRTHTETVEIGLEDLLIRIEYSCYPGEPQTREYPGCDAEAEPTGAAEMLLTDPVTGREEWRAVDLPDWLWDLEEGAELAIAQAEDRDRAAYEYAQECKYDEWRDNGGRW